MSAPRTKRPGPALPAPLRALLERRFADEGLELPLLPDTAAQVLSLCNEETCDARSLAALIERDQSLAGHVLRVSNSAAWAPKEPIVSLQQAVSRLGTSNLCEIAIAVSLEGRVFRVPGHQVRIREMWMHSAAAAVYAKEVARRLRRNVESAFLCGLLHDVGKPIVLQVLLDSVRTKTDAPVPAPLLEAAMDEFHAEVGARMALRWSLPAWAARAIAGHHDYASQEEHREEAMVAHLADLLSHWALDSKLREDDFERELPVLDDLGLYEEDLDALLEKRGGVLEVAEAFL
jgi:putative nucleotidyltransferase with HDIG domain